MNRNQAIPRRMSRAMRYVDKLTLAMKAVFRPDLNRAGDLKRTESTIAVAAHDCRGAGARASAPSGCKLCILFAIVEPLVRLDDHASCRTRKPSTGLWGLPDTQAASLKLLMLSSCLQGLSIDAASHCCWSAKRRTRLPPLVGPPVSTRCRLASPNPQRRFGISAGSVIACRSMPTRPAAPSSRNTPSRGARPSIGS